MWLATCRLISRARQDDGSYMALMLIKTDGTPTRELLEGLRKRPNIVRVQPLTLPARA